jgi:DNA-binding MarR family transcriptional regulator
MSGAYEMLNRKVLVTLENGQDTFVDVEELIVEKYGISPDKIKDLEVVKTFSQVHKRHFKKGEFFMQSFAFDHLIMERGYNLNDLRLIIALRRRLDFNNRIQTFRQFEIAEELKTGQSNISRAMKKLLNDEVIYKDGHDYYFSDKYIKGAGDRS